MSDVEITGSFGLRIRYHANKLFPPGCFLLLGIEDRGWRQAASYSEDGISVGWYRLTEDMEKPEILFGRAHPLDRERGGVMGKQIDLEGSLRAEPPAETPEPDEWDPVCLICGKPVPDYKPERCCNGDACGCRGMPIHPCTCSDACHDALMDGIGKPYDERRKDAGIDLPTPPAETPEPISRKDAEKLVRMVNDTEYDPFPTETPEEPISPREKARSILRSPTASISAKRAALEVLDAERKPAPSYTESEEPCEGCGGSGKVYRCADIYAVGVSREIPGPCPNGCIPEEE